MSKQMVTLPILVYYQLNIAAKKQPFAINAVEVFIKTIRKFGVAKTLVKQITGVVFLNQKNNEINFQGDQMRRFISFFIISMVGLFITVQYSHAKSTGCIVSSNRFGDYRGDYPSVGLTNMCQRSVRARFCWSYGRCRCKSFPPKRTSHYLCKANFSGMQSWPTGMHGHGTLYWKEFK